MSERRITLTDVMIGIDKHGLVCKLSEESFTFFIGMILEHNKLGFKDGFDMTNSQAMAAGGGNTPKSVRRRRATLTKFRIDGKPLLKVYTGNYGRNTCAKYEINYKSLLSYNGVWSGQTDLPTQRWDSSGESGGRVEGRVEGTVPGPILRSDQKREEEISFEDTSKVATIRPPQPDGIPEEKIDLVFEEFYGAVLMEDTPEARAKVTVVSTGGQQKAFNEIATFPDSQIQAAFKKAGTEGKNQSNILGYVLNGLEKGYYQNSGGNADFNPKVLTHEEKIREWLEYCSGFANRRPEIYGVLKDLAKETGRTVEAVHAESHFLGEPLDSYFKIAQEEDK